MLFRIYLNLDVNRLTQQSCLIQDKYLDVDKTHRHKANEYTVVTSCGIYNLRNDQLINQKDSDELYNSLNIGSKYDIESVSYNIPSLSFHPRIIKVKNSN